MKVKKFQIMCVVFGVWQKKGSFIFWVYVEIVTKAVVGPTENFISRL